MAPPDGECEYDMIKNIIFDVGKVLVEYDPYTYVEKRGYSMETQVSTKEKEGGFLTNLLNKEKDDSMVQQYSFDVRA